MTVTYINNNTWEEETIVCKSIVFSPRNNYAIIDSSIKIKFSNLISIT